MGNKDFEFVVDQRWKGMVRDLKTLRDLIDGHLNKTAGDPSQADPRAILHAKQALLRRILVVIEAEAS